MSISLVSLYFVWCWVLVWMFCKVISHKFGPYIDWNGRNTVGRDTNRSFGKIAIVSQANMHTLVSFNGKSSLVIPSNIHFKWDEYLSRYAHSSSIFYLFSHSLPPSLYLSLSLSPSLSYFFLSLRLFVYFPNFPLARPSFSRRFPPNWAKSKIRPVAIQRLLRYWMKVL